VSAYEAALERERTYPQLQTRAFLDFPCLIVTLRLSVLYSRAIEILDASHARLMFPVDRYLAYGVRALIFEAQGNAAAAVVSAKLALAAVSETHSGFRNHPKIGVVRNTGDEFGSRLQALVQARH
jgi:hypothetical protein